MGYSPWGCKESDKTERLTLTFTWCPTLGKHKGDTSLGEHSTTKLALALVQGFPCGSADKGSTCHAGDLGSIPGLGRSPGGGHGNPLQYSCLENLHGQKKLVGYSPWDHKESDTTERLSLSLWVSGLSCTRDSSKSAESPSCLLPSARKQESLRQTKS